MARAIEQLGNFTAGYAALGLHGERQGSVKEQVHDGDTIAVRATGKEPEEEVGNFGVRFLGVDAPEISFSLAGRDFVSLGNQAWEDYLSDPFAEPFEKPLNPRLLEHLNDKVGPGAAKNHFDHAKAAEDALEKEIADDINALGKTVESFRLFLAFAYEVMDRYGRFLCFVNRFQAQQSESNPRPESYNESLLRQGMVSPYFIWPNIDPFRKEPSVVDAVIEPGEAAALASGPNALAQARRWVREAREQKLGIFEDANPLRLAPFEVRFLGRRQPPDRWVIDLSKDEDVLLQPQEYHVIPNIEDRLFVAEEYVPLFVERGWRRQAFPGD
jgi:endonuclease YncB( thermonuclease family)